MNSKRLSHILILATVLGAFLPILGVSPRSLSSDCHGAPNFRVKVENQTSAIGGSIVPIVLSELTYKYGKTVTVEVWILGVRDMFGYQFTLNWPDIEHYWVLESYTVESIWTNQFVVLPDVAFDLTKLGKANTTSYTQAVVAYNSTGVIGDFKLATLKFRIYNDICNCQVHLEFMFSVTRTEVSDSCTTPILLCAPDDAMVDWGWYALDDPPPFVSFDYSPPKPMLNAVVLFNASASHSDYGDMSYQWYFGDGNTTMTTDPLITHIYASSGNYSVTLIGTDTQNFSNSKTLKIEVLEAVHDVAATRIQRFCWILPY